MAHDPPRVLVVDDIAEIRALISINLELEGFEVHTAATGRECLELVGAVAPDVITLDVAMPELDGFATAEALRRSPQTSHIPLVIVSAKAQGYDLARGAELGAHAYVTKPFDPRALVELVRTLASGAEPLAPPIP